MKTKLRSRCAISAARWASYALAGAATAMAANNDAEAEVFYSGLLNTSLVGKYPPGPQNLNAYLHTLISNGVPGAKYVGVIQHRIVAFPFPSSHRVSYHAYAIMLSNPTHLDMGQVRGSVAGYASKLALGANISAGPFNALGVHNKMATNSLVGDRRWTTAGTGFLGFEFNIGAGEQYGWVRVTIDGPKTNNMTLIDYAYGSPGQAMTAGEQSEWTGAANSTVWAAPGNWNGVVPGATSGTTSVATATFDLYNASYPAPVVDSGRNLQNIVFDNSGGQLTNSLSVGTSGGSALLLTEGGTIQTTASVANPQSVNAPLTLEGTASAVANSYSFISNSTTGAATLNFGGAITSGASMGVTTLNMSGTNAGTNTIAGPISNGTSGATLALAVQGSAWALTAANSYSGGTTVANGATLVLANASGSALTNSMNIANSGSLVVGTANQVVGTVTGPGSVVVNANSSLTAYQIRQNSLTIGSGATVTLFASGSGSTTNPAGPNNINFSSSVNSLSIAGTLNAWTGTLDIGNNGLVIAYGNSPDPYSTINNMVESGYNGGVWGGTGITSSLAQAGVTMHISTPLNIGLLDFTPGTGNYSNTTFIVFEGQMVTTNAILVRLTYMDDLVLAGDMASNDATSDALLFAANYGTGTTWAVGDLVHGGGPINSSDALLFAANYVVGLPSLDGSTGGDAALASGEAAVPEPASLGLLACGALGLLALRRGRERKKSPAANEFAGETSYNSPIHSLRTWRPGVAPCQDR